MWARVIRILGLTIQKANFVDPVVKRHCCATAHALGASGIVRGGLQAPDALWDLQGQLHHVEELVDQLCTSAAPALEKPCHAGRLLLAQSISEAKLPLEVVGNLLVSLA